MHAAGHRTAGAPGLSGSPTAGHAEGKSPLALQCPASRCARCGPQLKWILKWHPKTLPSSAQSKPHVSNQSSDACCLTTLIISNAQLDVPGDQQQYQACPVVHMQLECHDNQAQDKRSLSQMQAICLESAILLWRSLQLQHSLLVRSCMLTSPKCGANTALQP